MTPALYTTVEWFLDDEKVCDGKKIHLSPLPAGEYILKIVATTTKGKQTSRTGKLDVLPLDGDPVPTDDVSDRKVVPGMTAKLHGTNMEKVVKITIGERMLLPHLLLITDMTTLNTLFRQISLSAPTA